MTISQNDLEDDLKNEQFGENGKDFLARLKELVFTWKVEEVGDPVEAEIIMGFSLGYVLDKNGNRLPGQINQQLADRIVQYCNEKPRRVYVQWEIADAIGDRLPDVISIGPDIDEEKGEVKYLSTKDVLRKIKERIEKSNDDSIGPILVVAHSKHLFRCTKLIREQGFSIRTNQANMPTGFDSDSAQPWTRNLRAYIINEIISRLALFRDQELDAQQ